MIASLGAMVRWAETVLLEVGFGESSELDSTFGTWRLGSNVDGWDMLRIILVLWLGIGSGAFSRKGTAESTPWRCEVIPQAGHQISVCLDGVERTRWHFGNDSPRPYFFPFVGPSGASLTRIGHPGAPDHDHHRSIWFAHHRIDGIDFWSDQGKGRVRQKQWYAFDDSETQATMAVALGWYGGDGKEVLEQDLVTAMRPGENGEVLLEIQSTFRPPKGKAQVELGKTNFGFLAVRVAKSVSTHFGGGIITDSEGRVGESAIFGKRSRWMDYSGRVPDGDGQDRRWVNEGITVFDHPANPRHPCHWHVRGDGWMGASFGMQEGLVLSQGEALTLRYLLHGHRGPIDRARAEQLAVSFAKIPRFVVRTSQRRHRQYDVVRESVTPGE